MPEERLHACAYQVLRYTPNLVRDEWVNIGVLVHDPAARRVRVRLIEEPGEFARLRRLHPSADVELVRALEADLQSQISAHEEDPGAYLAQLDETLSNVLQLSPRKGLLAENVDAELDRLYHDHVAPPRYRARPAAELAGTRAGIRRHASEVFRRAGLLERMERSVRVDTFTFKGDPFRLDYAYRRNGTQGFVHALALARDHEQAKVFAFTAARIRARIAASEFTAITEVEPRAGDERHAFIAGVLAEQAITLVPLARLGDWATRLRPSLQ